MMTNEVKLIVNTLRECAVATPCSKCVVFCENDECFFTATAKVIESLAAELEQVKQERDGLSIMLTGATSAAETYKRERDAAVQVVKKLGDCKYCKHDSLCQERFPVCGSCEKDCPCNTCNGELRNNWQWRGVKEG